LYQGLTVLRRELTRTGGVAKKENLVR
jgi:hypothetical protein